jgi:integrase
MPGLGAYQSGINPGHLSEQVGECMRRPLLILVQAEAWSAILDKHIEQELPELSKRRRYKVRNTLEIFARKVQKHPNDVSRKELEEFFESLSKRGLKAWTIRDYKIVLKRFYRKRKGKKFVEWIKIPGTIPSDLGPEDLISEKEEQDMLRVCENLRDKAMITVLKESDFRPLEFLSMKRKNVAFDKYGATIHIEKGKTGPRVVRIISSAPYLANWLANHPAQRKWGACLDQSFYVGKIQTACTDWTKKNYKENRKGCWNSKENMALPLSPHEKYRACDDAHRGSLLRIRRLEDRFEDACSLRASFR